MAKMRLNYLNILKKRHQNPSAKAGLSLVASEGSLQKYDIGERHVDYQLVHCHASLHPAISYTSNNPLSALYICVGHLPLS